MGLNIHTLDMFFEMMQLLEIPLKKGLKICELGNLYVRQDTWKFLMKHRIPTFKTAKELFTYLGLEDTSIDLNGQDGALQFDLGEPITIEWLVGQFDILLNGGTCEHVYDQYECWRNVHYLCKNGALILSIGPLKGNWLKHSPWRYSLEFFDCLCFQCDYDLLESKVVNFKKQNGFDCHYVSFRKSKDNVFISKDLFRNIWNNTQEEKIK